MHERDQVQNRIVTPVAPERRGGRTGGDRPHPGSTARALRRRSPRGSPCCGRQPPTCRRSSPTTGRISGSGARQINDARAFGTDRYVSVHDFLEPNDRPDKRATEPGTDLGARGGGADLRRRLFPLLGTRAARPGRPADPGVRHRGTAARFVSRPGAGAGDRSERHGHRPDGVVPRLRRLYAGGCPEVRVN